MITKKSLFRWKRRASGESWLQDVTPDQPVPTIISNVSNVFSNLVSSFILSCITKLDSNFSAMLGIQTQNSRSIENASAICSYKQVIVYMYGNSSDLGISILLSSNSKSISPPIFTPSRYVATNCWNFPGLWRHWRRNCQAHLNSSSGKEPHVHRPLARKVGTTTSVRRNDPQSRLRRYCIIRTCLRRR
jgi:hypothetical protein